MLCDDLEKYHSFPGLTLLLGNICQYRSTKQLYALTTGIVASSYLFRKRGNRHILDGTGLFQLFEIQRMSSYAYIFYVPNHCDPESFSHLRELLENPERSGTHIFDQQRYAMAAKECLQLYLCSRRNFFNLKGATRFSCHDKAMRRSKPWEWVARLGVHSRIWKARHYFKVLKKSLEGKPVNCQHQFIFFPKDFPKHQYLQLLSYRWALDLLPLLLEKSAVSLELADVLHGCTFTMMAWEFPQRMLLAKMAIARYLLWVESAAGEA
jgi:hypothetical protein